MEKERLDVSSGLMKNVYDDGAPKKMHSEKQMYGGALSGEAEHVPGNRGFASPVRDGDAEQRLRSFDGDAAHESARHCTKQGDSGYGV